MAGSSVVGKTLNLFDAALTTYPRSPSSHTSERRKEYHPHVSLRLMNGLVSFHAVSRHVYQVRKSMRSRGCELPFMLCIYTLSFVRMRIACTLCSFKCQVPARAYNQVTHAIMCPIFLLVLGNSILQLLICRCSPNLDRCWQECSLP